MRKTGTIELMVNGEHYSATGSFKVDPGGIKSEEANVDLNGQVVGPKQTVHPNVIEGEIFLKKGQKAKNFVNFNGARVVVKTAEATYVQPDAWYAGTKEIDLESDKIPFRSIGSSIEEI